MIHVSFTTVSAWVLYVDNNRWSRRSHAVDRIMIFMTEGKIGPM
jgi:hypothetical protein